jgi:hypothetical protein
MSERDNKYLDQFQLPASAREALTRTVGDDLIKAIVADNYKRWAPTPPKPKSEVASSAQRSASALLSPSRRVRTCPSPSGRPRPVNTVLLR